MALTLAMLVVLGVCTGIFALAAFTVFFGVSLFVRFRAVGEFPTRKAWVSLCDLILVLALSATGIAGSLHLLIPHFFG